VRKNLRIKALRYYSMTLHIRCNESAGTVVHKNSAVERPNNPETE
jgi:hypothetical protein